MAASATNRRRRGQLAVRMSLGATGPPPDTVSLLATGWAQDPRRLGTRALAAAEDQRHRSQPAARTWRGGGGGAAADHRLSPGAGGVADPCLRRMRAAAATDDSGRHETPVASTLRRWGEGAAADHHLSLGAGEGARTTPTGHAGFGGRRQLEAPQPAGGEHLAWVGRRRRGQPPLISSRRRGCGTCADRGRGRRPPRTTRDAKTCPRRAIGVVRAVAPPPITASLLAPGAREARRRGSGALSDMDVGGGGLRCRAAPRWSFRARRRDRGVGDAGGGGRQRPAVSGPLRATRPRGEKVAPR